MIKSGCNVVYHTFVHFEVNAHMNGMIEDRTMNKWFEVLGMFYTILLLTLERRFILMVMIEDYAIEESF